MSKKVDLNSINRFEKNFAESVSFNEETARTYLEESGVDLDKFIKKGLNQIHAFSKKDEIKNSRSLFFKRVVLGAEIVNSLYLERTFGHVKLMKLMYLCEQVSNMKLSARYVKQAAGPYDARFMHSIDREFMRLNWFDVKVKTQSKFKTYEYIPADNLLSYKKYFSNYYTAQKENISWLIDTFGKRPTSKVELISTIYSCLDEFEQKDEDYSIESLIEKVFNWSEEKKKKFTKENVINAYEWMLEKGLVPAS